MGYNDEFIEGEVVTAEDRIRELEDEIGSIRGRGGDLSRDLMAFVQNPRSLTQKFNLTGEQASNVKSLITGASTAASTKYLGKTFGDEIAAIMGAAASAYLARKLFGG